MLRVFVQAAIVLVIACAVISGGMLAFGKIARSNSGIVYATATRYLNGNTVENTLMLDPQLHIRYDLTQHYGVRGIPVPSANGQKIAYVFHDVHFSEIRVLDFATGQNSALYQTVEPTNGTSLSALVWSPSGNSLAFSNGSQILKFDFVTKSVRFVTPDGENDTNPSWSSDETRLAFASATRETGHWQIYIVNADGSHLQRITRTDVCLFYTPHWSPQSNLIVIDGRCDNVLTLFLYDADSGSFRSLTDLAVPTWGSVWSPDGRHILFTSGANWQDQTINVIDADGSGLRRLASGSSAYWSPDGAAILFNALPGDLYTGGINGDETQRLTISSENSGIAAWAWGR